MKTIKAINPKHQPMVNRAVQWLTKYDQLNDLRNIADSDGDEREYNRLDKSCQKAFDRYLDYFDELPKREQQNIENKFYN